MKIFTSRTFTWQETGLIKICLLSLGILLGLYFPNYLGGFTGLLWVLFIVTAAYFIIRFLREK
ncbi:MAG: hypothetical protein AAB367_02680 [Patescibacteria group bacterium]